MDDQSKKIDSSRRHFLKGCIAATVSAALPAKAFPGILNREISPARKIINTSSSDKKLLKFAHITDIHIGDIANKIRANLLGGTIAFFYERPQDPMCAALLNSAVSSINSCAAGNDVDFCMATGDLIDMSMEREIHWLVDILDGKTPENFRENKMVSVSYPHGMETSWYGCLGNHDLLLFGSLPSRLIEHIVLSINEQPDFNIISQNEWIDTVTSSTTPVYGHGFFLQPEKKDGYYSYSPNEYIHCIVLNTTADNHMEGLADNFLRENHDKVIKILRKKRNVSYLFKELVKDFSSWAGKEKLYNVIQEKKLFKLSLQDDELNTVMAMGSDGTLDNDQYEWMINEIESNQEKLCIIFSHHGSCDFMNIPGNINQSRFEESLCKYNNVIAHVCGHSHENKIEKIRAGNSSSFYRIRTSSLIEYPQEWRSIEIFSTGGSKGKISCKMFRHEYLEAFFVASNHWRVQLSKKDMYGSSEDRDVDLEFEIPDSVIKKLSKPVIL